MGKKITQRDVQWAFEEVLTPLLAIMQKKAREFGWNYVGGIENKFAKHGYCASDNWIITYPESFDRQGKEDGTLHPNGKGHLVYKKRLFVAINGVWVDSAYTGDTEYGTAEEPFKQFASGFNDVFKDGTLYVRPGINGMYTAGPILDKPMIIKAPNGPVILKR